MKARNKLHMEWPHITLQWCLDGHGEGKSYLVRFMSESYVVWEKYGINHDFFDKKILIDLDSALRPSFQHFPLFNILGNCMNLHIWYTLYGWNLPCRTHAWGACVNNSTPAKRARHTCSLIASDPAHGCTVLSAAFVVNFVKTVYTY
jgi:hypothetical protein